MREPVSMRLHGTRENMSGKIESSPVNTALLKYTTDITTTENLFQEATAP